MKCLHPVLENRRAWPGEAFDIAECVECHSTVSIPVEEPKVRQPLRKIKSYLNSLLSFLVRAIGRAGMVNL